MNTDSKEEQFDTEEEYLSVIDKICKTPTGRDFTVGSSKYYLKEFLKQKYGSFWSQPEATAFCNRRVKEDGGVEWHNKSHGGKGKGKTDSDGHPLDFGDPGRGLEAFRREDTEGCWDNQTGKSEGPFRLNIKKYKEFMLEGGPTKCHSFTSDIKKTVKKRAKDCCELCGHKGKCEVDHFMPKEKGGTSTIDNANYLCSRCNDRKCAKLPEEFVVEEMDRSYAWFISHGGDKEVVKKFLQKKMDELS